MGLIASLYRSQRNHGGCSLNRFEQYGEVCLVNVEGPFEPTANCPPALLHKHAPFGDQPGRVLATIVPCEQDDDGKYREIANWTMFGGAYCSTTDSRFSRAVEAITGQFMFNGALPVHDRVES